MDPTVVTIFCCGTAFHRDKTDFIVPYTWRATKGDRVWMNDGPGNTDHHILKSEAILKRVEAGKGVTDSAFDDNRTGGMIGQAFGTGTQDNIVTTLQWLWMEFYRKDAPTLKTINLVGWSRGAVTCIMLAHAIEAAGFRRHVPTLKVNIFAIDPVPGGVNDFGDKGTFASTGRIGSTTSISKCVNEYCAVLAEHVGGMKGKVFKNVSPDFDKGTHGKTKREYPMPGGHSTVANHRDDNPVGRIATSLCHEFLIRNGTELIVRKTLSDPQKLDLYGAALLEHGGFKKKGFFNRRQVFEKKKVAKERKPTVANRMRKHPFFLNGHHSDLFRTTLPQVWDAMANGQEITKPMQSQIAVVSVDTYNALVLLGYFD